MLTLLVAVSCARHDRDASLKLNEDIYGFFLGEAKDDLFRRAKDIATITKAPDPPLGYRGELWNFSAPLEPHREVDHTRIAFFDDRVLEIVVYFRDTGVMNLNWLKYQLEGQFRTEAITEDGTVEMAYKTYRLKGPGLSITLRRLTKKSGTELYVQYIHDELHRRLVEKNRAAGKP